MAFLYLSGDKDRETAQHHSSRLHRRGIAIPPLVYVRPIAPFPVHISSQDNLCQTKTSGVRASVAVYHTNHCGAALKFLSVA